MLHLLRDASWQFWGTIVGIAALVFSLYIFFYSNTKSLEVAILANAPLVEINPDATEKITVFYGTQPVENPLLLQVRLESVGTEEIREEDYASPISVVFPNGSRVLEASITDTDPKDIGMTVQVDNNTATLSKSLLNSGDRIVIRMLVDNASKFSQQPFEIHARIAGVKQISVVNALQAETTPQANNQRPLWVDRLGGIALLISTLVLIGFIVIGIIRLFLRQP